MIKENEYGSLMLTDEQKITVAKNFISRHKWNDIDDWVRVLKLPQTDNDKYLFVYYNLLIRSQEFDSATQEYEISKWDSISGKPVVISIDELLEV